MSNIASSIGLFQWHHRYSVVAPLDGGSITSYRQNGEAAVDVRREFTEEVHTLQFGKGLHDGLVVGGGENTAIFTATARS